MPSDPAKSSAMGSNNASVSCASAAVSMAAIVLRSACSGGSFRQPDRPKASEPRTISKMAFEAFDRGLPAFGACAPIGSNRGNFCMSIERPWLASYPAFVPAQINVDEFPSIVSVFDQACDRFRENPAFTNLGTTLTYEDLDRLSARFACYLLNDLKLKKGDRVAIMMPNCLQYPIAIFGVLRAGLTVVNVNPMYTPRELKHQLVDSGASVLLVVDNFGKTAQEALAGTQVRQVITTALGDLVGFPKGAIVNFVL